MSINATLLVQMAVFAFFVWFTMKYVWPPILAAIHERQKLISDGLAHAERARLELAKSHEQAEVELVAARTQAAELLAKANQRSNEIVEEAKVAALEQGDRLVANAKAEIERETARARDAIRRDVSALAIAGAGKIIGKELDATTHNKLIDDLVAQAS